MSDVDREIADFTGPAAPPRRSGEQPDQRQVAGQLRQVNSPVQGSRDKPTAEQWVAGLFRPQRPLSAGRRLMSC
jgi:hypothetical protein